ncbi:type IV pilus biogenesis/stability protein PilW [Vibrio splendidus]|uniref:type IV pilus biogenesis/stability protein PilW n=1 Tax=Vibrio splendidus TaxID=29497 RepID=UPI000D393444|nr:type IV pilus biogenesis/stability protein PilW [Vibrio splendidus]MDH6026588.1 type IV pilus biogenesis/stability protein PilW [Vibrio splendidus]PTQ16623.1 type IV pilus biogenesis/stability protein PilW [Vibrio splendidus]UOE79821.1 type IV pilus biogenesis/stability protein PilW [Vibrio splendidus]
MPAKSLLSKPISLSRPLSLSSLILLASLSLVGCVSVTEGPPKIESDPIAMSESRIELGLGYMGQGNMVRARENLELAIKHAPSYYRARLSIAHYYEQVGEVDEARDAYKKALRLDARNGNVLNNYGTFLCKQGEYEQADKYFNRAIDQPYYYLVSASYENAAFCAFKAGEVEQAKYYFSRAIDHDPNRARSVLQLSKIEVSEAEYNDARLRLFQFHQRYGYQIPSLQILVELEKKAGNRALQQKYQSKLDELLSV